MDKFKLTLKQKKSLKWVIFVSAILTAVVYTTSILTANYICDSTIPFADKVIFHYLGEVRYLDPSKVSRVWDLITFPIFAGLIYYVICLAKNNKEGIFSKREYSLFRILPMMVIGIAISMSVSIAITSGFPLSKYIKTPIKDSLGEIGVFTLLTFLVIGAIFTIAILILEKNKDEKILENSKVIAFKGLEPLVFISFGASMMGLFSAPILLSLTCAIFLSICTFASSMIGSFLIRVLIMALYGTLRFLEKVEHYLDKRRKKRKPISESK